jgi:putative transposase
MKAKMTKRSLAKTLGISRQLLYYKHLQREKDWQLKCQIEEVLRDHPSYGHRRLRYHLKINKKRILRVMKIFGIKPYRRRGRKPKKIEKKSVLIYPNLLSLQFPSYPNHIWVSDFTYIWFKDKFIYLATIMDVFTRTIIGFSVLTNHSTQLVINALLSALNRCPRPNIFHSDNGKEYDSKNFINLLENLSIKISRSRPGCPWENGYQESFYSQFKVELGDPNRFETLGKLVAEIYQQIYYYNHKRIHTSLGMSPQEFAKKHKFAYDLIMQ